MIGDGACRRASRRGEAAVGRTGRQAPDGGRDGSGRRRSSGGSPRSSASTSQHGRRHRPAGRITEDGRAWCGHARPGTGLPRRTARAAARRAAGDRRAHDARAPRGAGRDVGRGVRLRQRRPEAARADGAQGGRGVAAGVPRAERAPRRRRDRLPRPLRPRHRDRHRRRASSCRSCATATRARSTSSTPRSTGSRKARAPGTLKPEELRGSTFTVTSAGKLAGLVRDAARSTTRRSAILGIHRIAERPVVRDGEIVARPIGHVSVTFDHRVRRREASRRVRARRDSRLEREKSPARPGLAYVRSTRDYRSVGVVRADRGSRRRAYFVRVHVRVAVPARIAARISSKLAWLRSPAGRADRRRPRRRSAARRAAGRRSPPAASSTAVRRGRSRCRRSRCAARSGCAPAVTLPPRPS